MTRHVIGRCRWCTGLLTSLLTRGGKNQRLYHPTCRAAMRRIRRREQQAAARRAA